MSAGRENTFCHHLPFASSRCNSTHREPWSKCDRTAHAPERTLPLPGERLGAEVRTAAVAWIAVAAIWDTQAMGLGREVAGRKIEAGTRTGAVAGCVAAGTGHWVRALCFLIPEAVRI